MHKATEFSIELHVGILTKIKVLIENCLDPSNYFDSYAILVEFVFDLTLVINILESEEYSGGSSETHSYRVLAITVSFWGVYSNERVNNPGGVLSYFNALPCFISQYKLDTVEQQ